MARFVGSRPCRSNRRQRINSKTTALATLIVAAVITQVGGHVQGASQEFYELRIYRLAAVDQQPALAEHLAQALLPALGRLGLDRIGVFKPLPKDEGEVDADLYVLIPYPDLKTLGSINAALAADQQYQRDAAGFFSAAIKQPAYQRIDSRLMKAFAGIPQIERADFIKEKRPRVFELRTYESIQTDRARMKVAMFNDGEIEVMRDSNLAPVFFGETLIGATVPNLTYMLAAETAEEHRQHFKAFLRHPEWLRMKVLPIYADTVSKIESVLLEPLPCSQL